MQTGMCGPADADGVVEARDDGSGHKGLRGGGAGGGLSDMTEAARPDPTSPTHDIPPARRPRRRWLRWPWPSAALVRANRVDLAMCLASGCAGAFVFPGPVHSSSLAWVALAPFFAALGRLRGAALGWGIVAFGLPWHWLSLFWLNTLVAFNPFIPAAVVLLAVLLTGFTALFAVPAAWALRRQPDWASPFTLAALWIAVEWSRGLGEIAFPWNPLAVTQGHGPMAAMIHWAEAGGTGIVGLWVAMGNGMAAVALRRFADAPRRRDPGAAVAAIAHALAPGMMLLCAFVFALGIRMHADRDERFLAADQPAARLAVTVVQPGVSQLEKWAMGGMADGLTEADRRAMMADAWDRSARIAVDAATTPSAAVGPTTATATADADAEMTSGPARLVVLPEGAFVSPWFVYDGAAQAAAIGLAGALRATVLMGADARETIAAHTARLARPAPPAGTPDETFDYPRLTVAPNPRDPATTTLAEPGPMATHNSVWMVTPEGVGPVVYHKIQLVPFGEMAPILDHIPWLRDRLMMVGTLAPGTRQNLFAVAPVGAPADAAVGAVTAPAGPTTAPAAGIPLGPMVCFESTFARLARGLAARGARGLVVVTNDAWYDPTYLTHPERYPAAVRPTGFGTSFWGWLFRLPGVGALASAGPEQHLSHSVLRAIETRLPVLRSAATGISAVIAPTGRVVERLEMRAAGAIVREVSFPVHRRPTAYTRRGDWPATLGVAAWLAVVAHEWRRRRAAAGRAGKAPDGQPDPAEADAAAAAR